LVASPSEKVAILRKQIKQVEAYPRHHGNAGITTTLV
jgi:hypothetical protein